MSDSSGETPPSPLCDRIPSGGTRDSGKILDLFVDWVTDTGLEPYSHQEEAFVELMAGRHVVLGTPTGSGKSLVAMALHFKALCEGERSFYTCPVKALASQKFFDFCDVFGAERVGMLTGDASINPNAPLICCTTEVLSNMALRQGAHGYVVKGAKSSELLAAIKAVDAGETYISPGVAGRILAEMADGQVIGNAPDLSEREQEILNRIAEGETNKEIAAALFLSEKTIKHYVTNVLTKLHVRNRVEAALKARSLRTP